MILQISEEKKELPLTPFCFQKKNLPTFANVPTL